MAGPTASSLQNTLENLDAFLAGGHAREASSAQLAMSELAAFMAEENRAFGMSYQDNLAGFCEREAAKAFGAGPGTARRLYGFTRANAGRLARSAAFALYHVTMLRLADAAPAGDGGVSCFDLFERQGGWARIEAQAALLESAGYGAQQGGSS